MGEFRDLVFSYLAEAFRIAAGSSSVLPEREHLQAVIQHCRGLVGALMAIADMPRDSRKD
jgi:hypothetical protein